MQGIATIETGIGCNNRCVFCYQLRYRGQGVSNARTDLSFDEIVRRLQFARDQGFKDCHLTGGEPTIRRDFFRLLRAAKDAGFEHCGVTTNGRMFSSLPFAIKAVKLGLDRASISIQSSDPRIHDGLSGVKGALDQTLAGIANLKKASDMLHRPVAIDTMTIVMKPNCQGMEALFRTLVSRGVRLFGIQPLITNRYNRHLMSNLYCTYSGIRDAVIPAIPVLDAHGARIRLFNLPPCLFAGHLDYFELSHKGFTIPEYREPVPSAPDLAVSTQFFKTGACTGCVFPCPGFRMEAYPQQAMLDAILLQKQQENHILTNLDLLTKSNLDLLLATLNQHSRHPLILFFPNEMRIGDQAMTDLILKHRPDAIIQYRPRRPRMEDNRLIEAGNESGVLKVITLTHGRTPIRLGIELGGLDFATPESFQVLLQAVRMLSKDDGLVFVLGPGMGRVDRDTISQRLGTILRESGAGQPCLVVDIGEDRENIYLSLLRDKIGADIMPSELKEIKAHGFQRT